MFSRRSHVPEEETSLSRAFRDAKREAHRGDRMLADLTQSNPTLVGLDLPEQEVLEALQDPRIMGYRPSPFGEQEARCAVADELGRCWEDVVLTSSTSESYAALLTLLCDPGDRVLIPNPGYPLIAVLIKNLGLVPVPYPVCWDGQWHIPELAHSLMTGARCLIVVSPNNPTGNYLKRDELDMLMNLGIPLIVDEVFQDYLLDLGVPPLSGPSAVRANAKTAKMRNPSAAESVEEGLVFRLGGLSKYCGFPQFKLAWIQVGGAKSITQSALQKLEHILDAQLTISAPVLWGARALLSAGRNVRAQIQTRITQNLLSLLHAIRNANTVEVRVPEGGWNATLRVPATHTEEAWCTMFLANGVCVHPGFYYDFAGEGYFVLSLLAREKEFTQGIQRLVNTVEGR